MVEDKGGFFKNMIARHVKRRADALAEKFGRNEDGSPNPEFSNLIRREVQRRGGMGYWLDVVEPLAWAVGSIALMVPAAMGLKRAEQNTTLNRRAWKFAFLTTSVNSAIQLIRVPLRYEFGLRGGVESARVIEEARKHNEVTLSPAKEPAPEPAPEKMWGDAVKQKAAESVQQASR